MVKERVIGGHGTAGVVTELYNTAVSSIEPRLAESPVRQAVIKSPRVARAKISADKF